MIRTQVYFNQEEVDLIEALAGQQGIKKSKMLRQLVRLGAKQIFKQGSKKKVNAGKTLMALANKAASGPKDLSENLSDYLYGQKSQYAS